MPAPALPRVAATSMEMLFGEGLHLARVRSLANGVAGALNVSVVSIAAIGRAYARLAMIESKSGVKQVDRLLSNEELKLEEVMPLWVKHVVGTTQNLVLATTGRTSMTMTTRRSARIWSRRAGRATPLAWKTVEKSTLKKKRDEGGYAFLSTKQWWSKEGIQMCVLSEDRLFCNDPFTPGTPVCAGGTVVDSQVGFEQQKFAMIFSLIFLPENARTNWIDQMRIYDLSKDNDPRFENRIEFHDPDGKVYVAQTFGTEVLLGKTVQRGIGARVLEYANSLLAKAFETEPVKRGDREVGLRAKMTDGNLTYLNGTTKVASCAQSAYCTKMKNYTAVPKPMYELESQLGFGRFGGWLKGVY